MSECSFGLSVISMPLPLSWLIKFLTKVELPPTSFILNGIQTFITFVGAFNLMGDKALQMKMGKNARKYILQNYNLDRKIERERES